MGPLRTQVVHGLGLVLLATFPAIAADENDPKDRHSRLDLTDPVVCLSINGFRDYEARDEPVLSEDEKLLIYYEPINYLIVRDGADGPYRAHLSQDLRLRRPGSDRVIRTLGKVIDYTPEGEQPPSAIYLATTLSIKGLPPGRYELDLILYDELAPDVPEAHRTVPFQVKSEP